MKFTQASLMHNLEKVEKNSTSGHLRLYVAVQLNRPPLLPVLQVFQE
jgi:hypothetical protein